MVSKKVWQVAGLLLLVSLMACEGAEESVKEPTDFDNGTDYSMPGTQKLSADDKKMAMKILESYNMVYGFIQVGESDPKFDTVNTDSLESSSLFRVSPSGSLGEDLQKNCFVKTGQIRNGQTLELTGETCPIFYRVSESVEKRNGNNASRPGFYALLKTTEKFSSNDARTFNYSGISLIDLSGRREIKGQGGNQREILVKAIGKMVFASALNDPKSIELRMVLFYEQKQVKSSNQKVLKIGFSGSIPSIVFMLVDKVTAAGKKTSEFYINGELQNAIDSNQFKILKFYAEASSSFDDRN